MYLILTPQEEAPSGIMYIFFIMLNYAIIYYGLIIGGIIATIFTFINLLFLRKLQYYAFFIRLGLLIAIAAIVGVIHYSLEKIIDVI
jgi:hypothetical protein